MQLILIIPITSKHHFGQSALVWWIICPIHWSCCCHPNHHNLLSKKCFAPIDRLFVVQRPLHSCVLCLVINGVPMYWDVKSQAMTANNEGFTMVCQDGRLWADQLIICGYTGQNLGKKNYCPEISLLSKEESISQSNKKKKVRWCHKYGKNVHGDIYVVMWSA